jgi:hypothetical protein
MGAIAQPLDGQPMQQPQPQPQPGPRPQPKTDTPLPPSPAAKLYKAKAGFANLYFNEQQRDKLLAAFKKHGDFSGVGGTWVVEGTFDGEGRKGAFVVNVADAAGKDGDTVVNFRRDAVQYKLTPLERNLTPRDLAEPPNSGGLMLAFYHLRRLLTLGQKGFEATFAHGGHEPFYPMPLAGATPESVKDLRVDTEVLRTEHGAIACKWYFSKKDQSLLGFEVFTTKDEDPCEVYCHDYRPVDGRSLPHVLEVRHGDKRYAVLTVAKWQLAAK